MTVSSVKRMSKAVKKRPRKTSSTRPPASPISQADIDAMQLALLRHSFSTQIDEFGPLDGCDPLDGRTAFKIAEAIALLGRILRTGKIHERPVRATPENLLAAALTRDLVRIFKVTQEAAAAAAFPNHAEVDRQSLARTYRNLLPKLAGTAWCYFGPPNLVLMTGYAAGFGKKKLSERERSEWGARARHEFQAVLAQTGKINRN